MQYTTIKIPVDIEERLRKVARKNHRSITSQIAYMLKQLSEEETFEEYFERNKEQLEKAYKDTLEGRNCYKFHSWAEAQDFLENKKKEWGTKE